MIPPYIICRQADQLLERLLVRMGLADSARQRRNLAFCISELTVTEKGVRKMVELIKYVIFPNSQYTYIYIYT